jgi:hypothetical protein
LAIHLTKGRAKACVIAVEDGCEDGACDQADGANSRLSEAGFGISGEFGRWIGSAPAPADSRNITRGISIVWRSILSTLCPTLPMTTALSLPNAGASPAWPSMGRRPTGCTV